MPDRKLIGREPDSQLTRSRSHTPYCSPNATALLVEKAASTDESYVRTATLDAIETSRDPSAFPGLINLFRLNRGQDDVVAQIEARQALLKIGAAAVPLLLQALTDQSAKVRRAVVEVLAEMRNPAWSTDRRPAGRSGSRVRRAVEVALVMPKAPKH